MTDDTAEWLTSRDTIETSIERDGTEYPLEVKDITQDELEALEAEMGAGADAEQEAIRRAIDEYLVTPDVDAAEIPLSKRQTLFMRMYFAWAGYEELTDAVEEMPLQGNG